LSGLKLRSLRVRLTLWYSYALISVALILAVASRWAFAVSLDHALDQSLRFRLIGLHDFIDENSHEGLDELAVRLRGLNHLGELFQVFGPHGDLMAQSDGLARHHASTKTPPGPGPRMRFRNAGPRGFPVRMATQRVYINGQPITLEVADPQVKFYNLLSEFNSVLFIALPFALAIAALGGYWISGRALRPVDRIIDETRSMDPANLAARLSVPQSGDELQRLSETLNQMLDRVEQSLGQVRQFTADASHELRAPLTLIYTAAQFALRRERSPEELKESLHRILLAAKRSTELINQLLWLARSDARGSRLNLVSVDLCAMVGEVVSEAKMLASHKELTISAVLPIEPARVTVDEESLRRMLLILLDNAVKYTAEGGSVTLRVSQHQTEVAIEVTDTGMGISADELPFIFDRFWRADKVRSRDAGGTGLGLAIAREIADLHHAKLSVQSLPGRGSTFAVRLPREMDDPLKIGTPEQQSV
jgi:heavy metal sensor kinase